MKNIKKISVGIPAYNEGANIRRLLNSILNQKEVGYYLLEIIIISDGSTDNTVSEVSKIKSSKLKFVKSSKRLGKSFRINQILQIFKGDILLLLDGDIIISDISFLSKFVKNNDFEKTGLIGVNARPTPAENFFQRTMNAGITASEQISSDWNQGQNYLAFKGCFLGLSRTLAKKITLNSEVVNNDAYIYFKTLDLGYKPALYKGVQVYFKSPKNFQDYLSQSKRFTGSKPEMQKLLKKDLSREYASPYYLWIKVILMNLISNPFLFFNYMIIKFSTLLVKQIKIKSTWNIAVSTK